MKKKALGLLGIAIAALALGGCASEGETPTTNTSTSKRAQTYTVGFEVDGERIATLRVKEGELITDTIPTPSKEGYRFLGWYLDDTLVDFSTYVVNGDVIFTAKFEEVQDEDALNVDDVKEEGKAYYLVLGWWETTGTNDDGSKKYTSYLTRDRVRLFYGNLINYLKASGATDENIAAISFRNYSTDTVSEMGEKVNADADVDLLIGVGNNINSTAGVALYNSSNDYKFQTPMSVDASGNSVSRYVACLSTATDLGLSTYDWLKNTDAGIASFVRELSEAEIEASLVPVTISLTVTVHGDTDETTLLDDKDDVVTMPAITIPDGKVFKGFALTEDGEVALDVAKNATLKYDDLKDLVAEGSSTLDLYPVFEDAPVVEEDLVVYVQVNGSNLTLPEAKLLEARFKATLTDENVKFNIVEGNANTFKAAVGNDADVVIGGNNPVNTFGTDETGPLADTGAKHFANTRKVIIRDTVASTHKTLAKALYDFLLEEAPAYELHTTFWHKNNEWVTEAERTAITEGITSNVETYLAIGEEETLADKYNVSTTFYTATNTKVADLCTETKALRDGKGTDLIVGCGGNVDNDGNMVIVEKKALGTPFVAASSRYVALVNDNPLAANAYNTYFVVAEAGE